MKAILARARHWKTTLAGLVFGAGTALSVIPDWSSLSNREIGLRFGLALLIAACGLLMKDKRGA